MSLFSKPTKTLVHYIYKTLSFHRKGLESRCLYVYVHRQTSNTSQMQYVSTLLEIQDGI